VSIRHPKPTHQIVAQVNYGAARAGAGMSRSVGRSPRAWPGASSTSPPSPTWPMSSRSRARCRRTPLLPALSGARPSSWLSTRSPPTLCHRGCGYGRRGTADAPPMLPLSARETGKHPLTHLRPGRLAVSALAVSRGPPCSPPSPGSPYSRRSRHRAHTARCRAAGRAPSLLTSSLDSGRKQAMIGGGTRCSTGCHGVGAGRRLPLSLVLYHLRSTPSFAQRAIHTT
jgi:hypothetical protein